MLKFLLTVLVFMRAIFCDLGLHFDYNTAYAPRYDNYKPRDYHFDYFVSDLHTGDHKSQWEVKENGVVRGAYSLLEPDGTTRIVEYIADDHGFRAIVKKIGIAIHSQSIQTHGEILPLVEPKLPELCHYKTYDGQVSNYANILESVPTHLESTPAEVPQIISVPHHLETTPPEVPQIIDEQHDIQQQNLLQPITYEIQQPLLYQHQQVYPGVIEVQNVNQHILSQPKAPGYGEEIQHVQPLGEVLAHKADLAGPVAPIISSVGPSYQTVIEYHGLTGNPEDDSRYAIDESSVNCEYNAESSEKVRKILAPPTRKENSDLKMQKRQKQFIIYYPDKDEQE